MKLKTKNNLAWFAILTVVMSGVIYILTPTIAVERSTPYDRRLAQALEDFHDAQGRYPELLIDLQPYLQKGTITYLQGNDYKVEIEGRDGRVYLLDAKYPPNPNGRAQAPDTRLIDTTRK